MHQLTELPIMENYSIGLQLIWEFSIKTWVSWTGLVLFLYPNANIANSIFSFASSGLIFHFEINVLIYDIVSLFFFLYIYILNERSERCVFKWMYFKWNKLNSLYLKWNECNTIDCDGNAIWQFITCSRVTYKYRGFWQALY